MNIDLSKIKAHLRDRIYMSGVDRNKLRVKETAEVFTPTPLVQKMLDTISSEFFADLTKTAIDPACGDGQFLSEVLIRKLENGSTLEQALSTIYGVDLMKDNVQLCRERLLCGCTDRHLIDIVTTNIVQHDALTYDYSFNGTNYTDAELREQQTGIPTVTKKPKKQQSKPKTETHIVTTCFE